MLISQAAFDLIVQEETGGQAYYEKTEMHPDWPGGASGVTVGCGYDCGYSTPQQIAKDWGSVLPEAMVDALKSVAGIKGPPAHSHALGLCGLVSVPWDAALKVFAEIDVPRWTAKVIEQIQNADRLLSPDSLGALVSLAFNRGASFTLPDDQYREMRDIRTHVVMLEFSKVPDDIRSMKRLWPHCEDLRNRRDHEAALFEKGLTP